MIADIFIPIAIPAFAPNGRLLGDVVGGISIEVGEADSVIIVVLVGRDSYNIEC